MLNGKDTTNIDNSGHFSATNLSPGQYIINIKDGNDCSRIDTIQISAIDSIAYSIIDTSYETCQNLGKIALKLLSKNPPITVNWINFKDTTYCMNSDTVEKSGVLHGKYKIYVSDDFGCYLDTIRIKIDTANWLYVNAGNDTLICRDTTYEMKPIIRLGKESFNGDGAFYNWEPAAHFVNPNIKNAVLLADAYKQNSHNYQLTVRVNDRCKVSSELNLGYYPRNGVYLPPLTQVSKGIHEIVPIIGGTGTYTRYRWDPKYGVIDNTDTTRNLMVQISDKQSHIYTLTGYTENGCPESASVRIEEAPSLKPDNAITPDGNGIHDKWHIENAELYNTDEITVEIFNRWGVKVYSSNGYDNVTKAWDGTYKGEVLPMGAYYYVITIKGEKNPLKGAVTILNTK
jgi:gliding motility-associated-like protein